MAKKKTAPAKQEDRLEVVKTSQIKKGDKVSAAQAFYTAVDDAYQDDASVWLSLIHILTLPTKRIV